MSDSYATKADIELLQANIGLLHGDFKKLERKIDIFFDKLDWFAGKYLKIDTEQTLLSETVEQHDKRLAKLEKRAGITV